MGCVTMYIDKNIGSITNVDIKFPFNSDRTFKPIMLVRENGSGKSNFFSNIVNSFYELTSIKFSNDMYQNEFGTEKNILKL